MCDAQNEICKRVSAISLPFIAIHGTCDTLVDISSSQFLYDSAQSEDKTFEVCAVCATALLHIGYTIRVCVHLPFGLYPTGIWPIYIAKKV